MTIDYAPELGKRFVTILEEWLTPEEFEQVRTLNDTRAPGTCASHDFCDANEAMNAAWLDVLNRHASTCSDNDNRLWSAAWDWAIEHYLSHSETAMRLEHAGFPEART
jgi:hypothetical protein